MTDPENKTLEKKVRKFDTIIVVSLFVVSFLCGLILGMSVIAWVAISVPIIAILVVSIVSKSVKELSGLKKVINAIALGLAFSVVLVPLVLLGTCLLGMGGNSLRGLFMR